MDLNKTTLLVVEDDDALRLGLSQVLTGVGYAVHVACEGFAALADIRTTIPDIVISDLNMPRMSGFELLSVLRRRFPSVWVIATSAAFSRGDLPPGVMADAFYEKGTRIQTLLSMIGAFADRVPRAAVQKRSSVVPVWVHETLQTASGEVFIIIPCPECLRTFPQARGGTNGYMHSTGCFYCGCVIHYAVVQQQCPVPLLSTRQTSQQNVLGGAEFKELLS